ncbi:MAG TPA: hypothetical protein VGN37_22870 [Actinocatenispora sp.]
MASNTDTTQIMRSELDEVRDELRRIDAKARDLLVIATLAVTVSVAVASLLDSTPPVPIAIGYVLAAGPWLAAVVQLILVVRPMVVHQPEQASASMDSWLHHRWQALIHVMAVKYTRVRRAVDLLLAMTGLSVLTTVVWIVVHAVL